MTEIPGTLISVKSNCTERMTKEDEKPYLMNDLLPKVKVMKMKNMLFYFASKNKCFDPENK